MLGDTLFGAGIVALVWFVAGLTTGHSIQRGQAWPAETGGLGSPSQAPAAE